MESLEAANTLDDRKWLVCALRATCCELPKTPNGSLSHHSRIDPKRIDREPHRRPIRFHFLRIRGRGPFGTKA